MKRRNKLITLIMAISILMGLSLPAAAESSDTSEQGQLAWEFLTAVGVFDENEGYISGGQISRGAFIRLAMKLGGYEPGVLKGQNVFEDVSALNENAGYIATAYNMGYIKGYPDGKLYPENPVTCAEALRLVSGLLGYGIYAEETGGYSTGYFKTADRLKLLSGTGLSSDGELTWDRAMILLRNTAEADMLEEVSFGGTLKMQSVPGKTLLTEKFSIYETNAVIEANEYTDIMAADSDAGEGCVLAGGIKYRAGSTNAADYLGMNMQMYYFKDDTVSSPELRYITPYKDKNTVIELNAEDIGRVSDTELSYTDANNRTKTLKLSSTASLIWNGKLSGFKEEKLMPEVGTVTLISNDADTVYDVIKVMSYTSYVVSGVSSTTSSVATKQGVSLVLDAEDDTYFTVIKKNGQKAGFEAISSRQVISYAESEAGKLVKTAELSDKTITGTADEIDGEDRKIKISGSEYRISRELASELSIGQEGTFYLDAFGRIVYFEGNMDIVYGYLNRIWTDIDADEEVFCRIFTENNRWVTLTLHKKVKLNGNSCTPEDFLDRMGVIPDGYRQLIRYRVNTDGEITVMETAKTVTMGTKEEKQAIKDDTFRMSSSGNTNYRSTTKAFNGIVGVASDAKLFVIPDQSDYTKEEDFEILTQSDLMADAMYKYEAYDVNEIRDSSVFTLYNYVKAMNTGSEIASMMLVQSIGQTLNADDEICQTVKGFWGDDEKITLPVNLIQGSSVSNVNTLKSGDIIQFTYNSKGEINNIDRKYSAGTEFSVNPTTPYHSQSFVAGKALAVSAADGKLIIQYESSGTALQYGIGSARIYVYESDDKQMYIGSAADLTEGDQVFVSARYFACKEVFILR